MLLPGVKVMAIPCFFFDFAWPANFRKSLGFWRLVGGFIIPC